MIERAVEQLQGGAVVVMPTDTVYGLAARPDLPDTLDSIFYLKRRPDHKALPVLGATVDALGDIAVLDTSALALAERFWPGPLTLVLPRAPGFDHELGVPADPTVAVRVPAHDIALTLLERTGPLAVTSANLSGEAPATTVAEARAAFGAAIDVYLDGGTCNGGASTLVSLVDELSVLRPGPITEDEIRQTLAS